MMLVATMRVVWSAQGRGGRRYRGWLSTWPVVGNRVRFLYDIPGQWEPRAVDTSPVRRVFARAEERRVCVETQNTFYVLDLD